MNSHGRQQKPANKLSPLYIIREDLSCTFDLYLHEVKKLLIEIEERITGNVFRVRLEWFTNGSKSKLYQDLVELTASRLKYYSLNNIYPLDVVKQNMVIKYCDDEDDLVTITSWLELAHAACIIGNNPLKLEVLISKTLKKKRELPQLKGDALQTAMVRVIYVSKIGADIRCGKHIFSLKKNGVAVLYFKNETCPIWRVYSNMKKAAGFAHRQPLARTYLFIHRMDKRPTIFVRLYPKGVHAMQQWESKWTHYRLVHLENLSKTWSEDEKKCGKGNVRLAFITPLVGNTVFDIYGSRDSSVILETRNEKVVPITEEEEEEEIQV